MWDRNQNFFAWTLVRTLSMDVHEM
uniref:Uncharacterized protein MANES_13G024700 n=1 Tax=Rhizophora mucronata TaxID=61149 RepID=A0A2P2LW11_RHIMU